MLVPVLAVAAAYLVREYARGRYATRFADARLLDRLTAARPRWRRHLPATLVLCTLGLLAVAFAGPADEVRVPRERATVIVAVDISPSMLATDVDPDRLTAAKAAAAEFVAGLPAQFNVGLVAFSGAAAVVTSPGTDRSTLQAGIAGLGEATTGTRGTAIGEAIVTALRAISGLDAQAVDDPPPARVVLLSDGANTAGRPPDVAAAEAAEAGVPVDTIAFGTPSGLVDVDGRTLRVPVDGENLRAVAEQTGGGFHEAASSEELHAVYEDIGSSVGFRTELRDISVRFLGLALLAGLVAAGASLAWFSRLV